jgi:hypothetical protein
MRHIEYHVARSLLAAYYHSLMHVSCQGISEHHGTEKTWHDAFQFAFKEFHFSPLLINSLTLITIIYHQFN